MKADWWMVSLTGGLVLVATVQAIMFWRQLRMIRETADLTRESVDAARRSADAAQQSANAAEKAANAALGVELPRLELDEVYWTLANNFGRNPIIDTAVTVRLRNRGRNAAQVIESCGVMALGTLPDKAVFPKNLVVKRPVGDSVRSEERYEMPFALGHQLPQYAAEKVLQGERLWVIGYVLYRDFLGDCWVSKFCLTRSFDVHGQETLAESYDYPHYTGRGPFDLSKPRTDLVDDMPGIARPVRV